MKKKSHVLEKKKKNTTYKGDSVGIKIKRFVEKVLKYIFILINFEKM